MKNLVLLRSDLRSSLSSAYKRLRHGKATTRRIESRVPVSTIKKMIVDRGLAVSDGKPSWFYTAYDRGDADPLTNYTLEFICRNVPHDAEVLVTGCGTGIMLFHLADQGFQGLHGFDYLQECIDVAQDVAVVGKYDVKLWQADGFKPSLTQSYDLITALHWVFSAWMGNYGNTAVGIAEAKTTAMREHLLREFLSQYEPHLLPGGYLAVELTDAVTDYRLPEDHPRGAASVDIYPVRHSPAQVAAVADELGLDIVSKHLCVSYGHHPRTGYILRKRTTAAGGN